jgi:hypothetical protein
MTVSANDGLWLGQGLTPTGLQPNATTGITSPTATQFAWNCQAYPGCVSGTAPADGLLVFCTKSCFQVPSAPSPGLGLGSFCFANGQCGSGNCSSTTDTGSPPFVCTDVPCGPPPCSIAGQDGHCHNSGDQGCNPAP